MKHLLVLGGGSAKNKIWVDQCREAYVELFAGVHYLYYDHWETEEQNLDFEAERKKVEQLVVEHPDVEWYIFAKSIGSIFTIKLLLSHIITPKKCAFFGLPFNLVIDSVFAGNMSVLEELQVPILAFHNEHDPTADYAVAKNIIDTHMPHAVLKTLPGNDHKYLDFGAYTESITTYLNA